MRRWEGLDIRVEPCTLNFMLFQTKLNLFSCYAEISSLKLAADSARGDTFQQVKDVVREGMYGRDADNN